MSDLSFNYFNYFTEIEEHFQRLRGTSLFLLSPLDWALIESWKTSGIPLEAVLRGIDVAFEKWKAKRNRSQMVNSLAFCAQAVLSETQRIADAGTAAATPTKVAAPFPEEDIRRYIEGNAQAIRAANIVEFLTVADALDSLAKDVLNDLETLEQSLASLEGKLIALARIRQSDTQALSARRELDNYLRPYRGKMTGPQLAMLETQFIDRAVLNAFNLPRLSLFHLR